MNSKQKTVQSYLEDRLKTGFYSFRVDGVTYDLNKNEDIQTIIQAIYNAPREYQVFRENEAETHFRIKEESKKFALFANYAYYPAGGMWDFRGRFSSLDEALKKSAEYLDKKGEWGYEWLQIVDLKTMKVVYAEGNSCYGTESFLTEK